MQCIINNQVVLSRVPDGPLAKHLGAFAQSRSAQGYAKKSIHRQVLLAAGFSHWLKQQGVALCHVSSDDSSRYLRDRARRVRVCRGDAAALRHLLDFLRREGVIAAERIIVRRLTPAERCAQEYAQYLHDARFLARATIVNYVPFIRGFLADRFSDGPVRLTRLNARGWSRSYHRSALQPMHQYPRGSTNINKEVPESCSPLWGRTGRTSAGTVRLQLRLSECGLRERLCAQGLRGRNAQGTTCPLNSPADL